MTGAMLADLSTNETYVLVALIGGLPAILTSIFGYLIHRQITTPSGKKLGAQVEDTLHTAIANYHYAGAISAKVGAEPSPQANGEAQKVEGLTAVAGETE